jgi:lipid-A-disaccharide synthase
VTTAKTKILIGTAERSGELRAATLVQHIRETVGADNVETYAIGSKEHLGASDITVPEYFDIRGISAVGLLELFGRPGIIIRWVLVFLHVKRFLQEHGKPDLFIAVSSFATNTILGYLLKRKGVRCAYYLPPQIWAWGRLRTVILRRIFDNVLVSLPFEASFYEKDFSRVFFCGYPRTLPPPCEIDHGEAAVREALGLKPEGRVILLLPGSRRQEISRLLPTFLRVTRKYAQEHPDTQLVIVNLPENMEVIRRIVATSFATPGPTVPPFTPILVEQPPGVVRPYVQALSVADLVLCSSGTATVDVMLYTKPMVVCYGLNRYTYFLARTLATRLMKRVRCFGLPNIYCVAEGLRIEGPVPELIQSRLSVGALYEKMCRLLDDGEASRLQRAWLSFIASRMINEDHYAHASAFLVSLLRKGEEWDRMLGPKSDPPYREASLSDLSNIAQLQAYHKRVRKVHLVNQSASGLCLESTDPIPLGRRRRYALGPEEPGDRGSTLLLEATFLSSTRIEGDRFTMRARANWLRG